MKNSRLIQLLETFSIQELSHFNKFILSPYFNEHQETILLFNYIRKTAPRFLHTRLAKAKAFQALYGKQAYDDQKMRYLMSNLFKLAELFLKIRSFEQQNTTDLLSIYRERNLNKHFERKFEQLKKVQANSSYQDEHYFLNSFQIENELSKFIEKQQRREKEPNLQPLSDSLDAFYLLNKLRCCCAILNYKNLATVEYHLPLIDEVMSHLATNDYLHIPAIYIYHKALLTLTETDMEAHFQELKNSLIRHSDQITPTELKDLVTLTKNYCIKKINMGDNRFQKDLFTLYQLEMDKDLLYEGKYVSAINYKNIVTLGLRLNEYERTKKFIYDFKDKLDHETKNARFVFNLARLEFSQKNYFKVIELLQEIDFIDVFLELETRSLMIRTFYELEEWDTLLSNIESLKVFLNRRKALAYHKDLYLHFIRLTKKMVMASNIDLKRSAIAQEIQSTRVIFKSWLLEKANN